MRWISFTILLVIATVLNSGNLLNFIGVTHLEIRPDLLLIMLVFFAIHCDWREGIAASFLIGFAADISGPAMAMGPHMLVYGILGSILGQMRRVVIMRRMIHQAVSILLIGIIAGFCVSLLEFLKTKELAEGFYWIVLGESLYSGLAGPLVWKFLHSFGWLLFDPKRTSARLALR